MTTARGFTKVPNDFLQAKYQRRFTQTELNVLDFVARYTHGYQGRQSHSISLGFIEKGTGIGRSQLSRAISKLLEDRVLICVSGNSNHRPRNLGINPNISEWKRASRVDESAIDESSTVAESATQGSRIDNSWSCGSDNQERKRKKKLKRKEEPPLRGDSFSSSIKGKASTGKKQPDPRFSELQKFLFATYEQHLGISLTPVFDGSDGDHLKRLLRRCPNLPLKVLQGVWMRFLASDDPFHRKQHGAHPVRFWCSNFNVFLLAVRPESTNRETRRLELERKAKQLDEQVAK